jgi:ABC-type glycerol-3-phosphate transport system permease component
MASGVEATQTYAVPQARRHSQRAGPRLGRASLYTIAILLGIVLMIPFFWAIDSSLKPVEEIRLVPPELWPSKIMWSNYPQVFRTQQFPFWVENTFIITVLASLGTIVTAALAGYAFARFRFPGREVLFSITLATLFLPETVTLIPSYILFYYLGWLDSFAPLIVPSWFGGGAFFIFLFRQFFMSLPTELDEAAKIDGANYLQILLSIIAPLSVPVLITVAIITFIGNYNSFLFPLIILNSPEKFTLSIGIRQFSISPTQDASPQDHILLAMSVMMMVPILIMFFLGQRYFVRGVVMSGLKG